MELRSLPALFLYWGEEAADSRPTPNVFCDREKFSEQKRVSPRVVPPENRRPTGHLKPLLDGSGVLYRRKKSDRRNIFHAEERRSPGKASAQVRKKGRNRAHFVEGGSASRQGAALPPHEPAQNDCHRAPARHVTCIPSDLGKKTPPQVKKGARDQTICELALSGTSLWQGNLRRFGPEPVRKASPLEKVLLRGGSRGQGLRGSYGRLTGVVICEAACSIQKKGCFSRARAARGSPLVLAVLPSWLKYHGLEGWRRPLGRAHRAESGKGLRLKRSARYGVKTKDVLSGAVYKTSVRAEKILSPLTGTAYPVPS